MQVPCSRCNALNDAQARFCHNCGQALASGEPLAAHIGAVPPNPTAFAGVTGIGGPHSPQNTPQVVYPYSPLAGRSVLGGLSGVRPASGAFWAGVCLIALDIILCPCATAISLFAASESGAEDPATGWLQALSFASCLFIAGLSFGALLVFVGRPRRVY